MALCCFARPADCRVLSPSCGRVGNFCLFGCRAVCLSRRVVSSGVLLARGGPLVEPAQQWRRPVPGTVEHADTLSVVAVLLSLSSTLVVRDVLSAAPFPGRHRHVFSGTPLDRQSPGGRRCRSDILVQWPDVGWADM